MAFVRYKTVGGKKYYQVVRNCREGGKHKQEVLCHLGPHTSLQGAIEATRKNIARNQMALSKCLEEAQHWAEKAQHTAESIREVYREVYGDEFEVIYKAPTSDEAWPIYDAVSEDFNPYPSSPERVREWNRRSQAATELIRQTIKLDDAYYWADHYQALLTKHRDRLRKLLNVRREYF